MRTNVISNSENWSYCDATGRHLLNAGAIANNEILPLETITPTTEGLYQYWPDSKDIPNTQNEKCDGYADCDENKNGLKDDFEVWTTCSEEPHNKCEFNEYGVRYGVNSSCYTEANCTQDLPGFGCSDSQQPGSAGDLPYNGYQWQGSKIGRAHV